MSVMKKFVCRNCVIKSNYEYMLENYRVYDNTTLLEKHRRLQRWFDDARKMLADDEREIDRLKQRLWKAEEALRNTQEQLSRLQETHSCGGVQSALQDHDKQ